MHLQNIYEPELYFVGITRIQNFQWNEIIKYIQIWINVQMYTSSNVSKTFVTFTWLRYALAYDTLEKHKEILKIRGVHSMGDNFCWGQEICKTTRTSCQSWNFCPNCPDNQMSKQWCQASKHYPRQWGLAPFIHCAYKIIYTMPIPTHAITLLMKCNTLFEWEKSRDSSHIMY